MINLKAILLSYLLLCLLACGSSRTNSGSEILDETELDSEYYLDDSSEEEGLISEIEVLSYSLTEEDSFLKPSYEFKFYELKAERIDSLIYAVSIVKNLGSKMQIQQLLVNDISDSCFVLNYLNNESDTLCNVTRGEYFEKYELIGQYLHSYVIRSSNWEESFLDLRSKVDGSRHNLSSDYTINRKSKLLLDYNSVISNPLSSDYLSITDLSDSAYLNLGLLYFSQLYPVDTYWVSDSSLIVKFAEVKIGDYDYDDKKYSYYRLRLKSKLEK